MSLSEIGTPCSGPRQPPGARLVVRRARRGQRAVRHTVMKALVDAPPILRCEPGTRVTASDDVSAGGQRARQVRDGAGLSHGGRRVRTRMHSCGRVLARRGVRVPRSPARTLRRGGRGQRLEHGAHALLRPIASTSATASLEPRLDGGHFRIMPHVASADNQTMRPQPLAYLDPEFMESDDGRPLRILAEYLEPLRRFKAQGIQDTVVLFGSARVHSREQADVRAAGSCENGQTRGRRRAAGAEAQGRGVVALLRGRADAGAAPHRVVDVAAVAHAPLRRDVRRRARHHGGRQPRRAAKPAARPSA